MLADRRAKLQWNICVHITAETWEVYFEWGCKKINIRTKRQKNFFAPPHVCLRVHNGGANDAHGGAYLTQHVYEYLYVAVYANSIYWVKCIKLRTIGLKAT